jgi:hypothetical protein
MGGMLAATFLAVFFVPWFFRLIFERRITESRSKDEIHHEIDRAKTAHELAHPPLSRARHAKPAPPDVAGTPAPKPGGEDD